MADINDIHQMLGHVVAKTDAILANQEAQSKEIKDNREDITSLKVSRGKYKGALSIVGMISLIPGAALAIEYIKGVGNG